ncbi:ankyrin repeat-containing [Fusarium longipes]|uniref:Ankyrin repeat-containing n=1 Tax=Fusarium longipes TaxID=694270 RepID=A0A395SCJ6_9HYPO|nr:ankyrin repeat-containing [Fusarium longipes]
MAATNLMPTHNDVRGNTAFNAFQFNSAAHINAPLSININTDSFADLCKSLEPYDFDRERTERGSTRTPDTCEWIIQETSFQQWISSEDRTFWMFGKPGSGKTFITDYVCSHLEESNVLMYFFFDSDNPQINTLEKFYRTCLYQLLVQVAYRDRKRILDIVHKEVSGGIQKAKLVVNAIKQVLKEFGSGYLIIDAIDECNGPKELKVNLLKDLAGIPKLKIMISSRPLEDIVAIANGSLQLQLSSVTGKSDRDIQLNAAVEDETDLIEELDKIPQDLSKIYAETLKKISVDSSKQFVRNIIRWLAVCKRPPSLSDLWAIHTVQRTTEFTEEFKYNVRGVPKKTLFRNNLMRHCVPLVEIVGEDETVSLIHTTVREFLEGKNIESEDDEKCPDEFLINDVESHGFAFITCMNYLRLDLGVFADNKPDFLNAQSFREYAVTKWESHCEWSPSWESNVIASFCGDGVFRVWMDRRASLDRSFREQFAIDNTGSVYPSPLHIVVYFSLFKVASLFLDTFKDEINYIDAARSTPLHVAVARGSQDFVRRMIEVGAQIEMADKNGSLPLHRAVRHGNYEAVRALIEEDDSGIMVLDNFEFTPLAIACQLGWKRCVEILLPKVEPGSDIARDAIGLAIENGHHPIVQRLLEWDESLINHCEEPFLRATRKGQVDMVKFLVQRGIDTLYKDKQGQTALHKACISGESELARLFIEDMKMSPDSTDESQRTPLYFAAERGYTEIVDCLIKNKADVNALDRRWETPLFKPAGNGHVEIVDRLLLAGTDATKLDMWRRTPLRFAALKGRTAIVQMLLERTNIDQDLPDWIDRTVLHTAASFLRDGQEDVIDLLVKHGAQVDKKTGVTGGGTALHEAIRREKGQPPPSAALIRRLIKVGVPINEVDANGKSALFYANQSGNAMIAKVLIDEGARPDSDLSSAIDIKSFTPLHLALLSGEDAFVLAMLETEWGRNTITRQDKRGWTVIHLAAYCGQGQLLSVLLSHLPGERSHALDIRDANGTTALHIAADQGHLHIVKQLLDSGALAYATDYHRFMPMHLAATGGHYEVVLELLDALPSHVERGLDYLASRSTEYHLSGPGDNDRTFTSTPQLITITDRVIELAFLAALHTTGALVRVANNNFVRDAEVWVPSNRPNLIGRVVKELEIWEHDRHSIPGTLLVRAIFGGNIELVKLVLERLPHEPRVLQAEQYEYPNALTLASAQGRADIVALLIEAGALVDAVTDKQESALHYAAINGHAKVIEQLLNPKGTKGTNPDLARLSDGSTPLHLAAEKGHDDAVRALANVTFFNAVDDLGRTPLHRACLSKHETTVDVLLEFAVDVLAKDDNGATPMDLCRDAGFSGDVLQRMQDQMDKQRLS